jgi:hypothetical protein
MTTINTVNIQRFSLNGIEYFKNFLSRVYSNRITIYNAYDSRDELVSNELFSDVVLNGTTYSSVALLQQALLPIIFNRDTLGYGSSLPCNLSYTKLTNGGTVNSDTGQDASLTLADTTYAGLMSPADKLKLDGYVNFDTDGDGIVDEASRMVTIGRNSTGVTLYAGTVVYIQNSTGNRPNYVKARADIELTSAGTFGVIVSDILNNADGKAVTIGAIGNLNTKNAANGNPNPFTTDVLLDGDKLYLDPINAGFVTKTKPSAPNHMVFIGTVVRTTPNLGTIVYRIQNGYELEELHNVAINGTLANEDFLQYQSSTALWKNIQLTATWIRTKLGITTLSGSNTGDNATNTQYSGLATSKQNTLVSATNIKTINGNSILGAGNLTISGGGSGIRKIYQSTNVLSLSGVTTLTGMASILIPANYLVANDLLKLRLFFSSLNTGSSVFPFVYTNTINSLTNATLLGKAAPSSGNNFVPFERTFNVKTTTISGINSTYPTYTDVLPQTPASPPFQDTPFNKTVDNYLIVAFQLGTSLGSMQLHTISLIAE